MNKNYFQAVFQIIKTGHWITDEVNRVLKEYDITEPQFNVLRILRGAKGTPLSVTAIQKEMVQRSSNITRIVDKLLKKNFVTRKECPENRRKMDILITDEGLEKLKILDKKVNAFHEPFFNKLNNEELDVLKNLIIKLKTQWVKKF